METFKVGEEVFVDSHYYPYIAKIDAITPVGNYKIGKQIFNKHGFLRGESSSFRSTIIRKTTHSICCDLKLKKTLSKISSHNWARTRCETLDKVYNLLIQDEAFVAKGKEE